MTYTIIDTCTGCTACAKICPVDAIPVVPRGQMHTILSNLCIDCGACGRVCPAAAILDNHAVMCVLTKRTEWFKPWVVVEKCIACNICIQACPADCLEQGEPRGKLPKGYPVLTQPKKCIGCHLCQWACPVDAIIAEAKQQPVPA